MTLHSGRRRKRRDHEISQVLLSLTISPHFLLFIFHYFGSVDGADALKTGANDILVVEQSDGTLKSTKIEAQVGKFNSFTSFFRSRRGQKVDVFINGQKMAFNQTLVVKGIL